VVILWFLLATLALGQEPEDGDEPEEIIVYGELLVARARKTVEREIKSEGYTEIIERGDKVIFRHPLTWKGEVVLHDDGWMEVRRQRVRFEGREMPWAEKNSPLAIAGCFVYPWMCIRPGGIMVGKRKYRAQEGRTLSEVHHEAEEWAARIADLSVDHKMNTLPDQLTALWNDGTPVEGEGSPIADYADRRKALLAFWESRTDTEWGERIREGVEAFIRAEVQHSEHPFSDDEIAAFNEESIASRPISLARPAVEEP
jgi:hypothetical protein